MAKANPRSGNDQHSGIARILPIVSWLPAYDRAWLRADIIAGLSVWALMVPTSMGYATISGVPVQYGLYAAAIGLIGLPSSLPQNRSRKDRVQPPQPYSARACWPSHRQAPMMRLPWPPPLRWWQA